VPTILTGGGQDRQGGRGLFITKRTDLPNPTKPPKGCARRSRRGFRRFWHDCQAVGDRNFSTGESPLSGSWARRSL